MSDIDLRQQALNRLTGANNPITTAEEANALRLEAITMALLAVLERLDSIEMTMRSVDGGVRALGVPRRRRSE
jgi:hypothetical protein